MLSQLQPIGEKKYPRRGRGLGSGRGSKSGRGTTRHQKARTTIPLHFEGGQGRIVKRYPLLRGKSRNTVLRAKPYTIKISTLNKLKTKDVVTVAYLIENKLAPASARKTGAKVLFDTDFTQALSLSLYVTRQAKVSLEKSGGTIIAS